MSTVNPTTGTPPPSTFPSGLPVDGLPTEKDIKDLPPLFRSKNLKLTPPGGKPVGGKGALTGAPALDGVDDDLDGVLTSDRMLSLLGDLEKILAESMTESNEKQLKLAKERIEVLKDQISKTKSERLKKVDDTMKEMDKASKMGIFAKVFGWLMTIFTVAMAIATSVLSGGALAGAALAGAVAAVTFQVLNETGVMDKLTKALTESLQKHQGHSKNKAQIFAQLATAAIQIGAMLACAGIGAIGGSVVSKVASEGFKAALKQLTMHFVKDCATKTKLFCEIALPVGGALMTGVSLYNGIRQKEAGYKQADLKELEGFLARLQQGLDETDEELQKIVEQMQALVADILKLVTNPVETSEEIVQNFV